MGKKDKLAGNWLIDFRYMILKIKWTPGVGLPPPRDNLHVYYHLKIFFFKIVWPIKAKFYRKHLYKGDTNVLINNPGHMTKMATMPIYGKTPSKIFFSGTDGQISRKLFM